MDSSNSILEQASRLDGLVAECHARVGTQLGDTLIDAELRPRLRAYWDMVRSTSPQRQAACRSGSRLPHTLNSFAGMFLLVVLNEGCDVDDGILDAAAACELYGFAISLLDAVQDDELEPPISDFGPAVASNAALIMFVQACGGIMRMGDRLPAAGRARLQRCFVDRSLISGAGQHRDLRCVRPDSLESSATQAQDKTTAIAMILEMAALMAGCSEERVGLYYRIGRRYALVRQCVNDLRDLYGKTSSDDLATGKWSLPLVAFWTDAEPGPRRELDRLRQDLPGSAQAIATLLFQSGAIGRVASVMEQARCEVHAAIEQLGSADAPIAAMGAATNVITSRIYSRAAA
ncbi:MAG: polyprenyl synthetase family protein [Deltaproteobacteria bacterium]|nr:polyprenyl synthetase family protein [Deltaproteobacteria bacterium]